MPNLKRTKPYWFTIKMKNTGGKTNRNTRSPGNTDQCFAQREESSPGFSLSTQEIKEFPLSVSLSLNEVFDEATMSSSRDLEVDSDPKNPPNISKLCRTKSGSKRTQQYIAKSRPEEIQQIIENLVPCISELMTDFYGNYMCQTLFQSCSSYQRLSLLKAMEPHLLGIAKECKGTHSLQTLISLSNLPEEEEVYRNAFKGHVLELTTHPNASHVVQRLLITFKSRDFVLEELKGSIKRLSMNKMGLCVIKKCVNEEFVCKELMQDPIVLMQDPYGNYAMQLTVEHWLEECSEPMMKAMKSKVAQLCIQKYASNVIEKCLKEPSMRSMIIHELITENKLPLLMNCPYGCYVLRTAAFEAENELKVLLRQSIFNSMPNITQKKLKSRWEEILKKLNQAV